MFTRTKFLLTSLTLVCVAHIFEPRSSNAQEIDIRIALSSQSFPSITPRLATELGLFKKNGINPTFVVADSGASALTALVAGSVEFATGGMDALIALRAQKQDSAAIATNIYRGQSGILVLEKGVIEKLGVGLETPADKRLQAIEGLTIAAPSASSSMVGTLRMASELVGGVNIKFVYMAQSAMPPALQTKSIDGYIASSPYPEQAVEGGFGEMWLSGPKREFPEGSLTNASLVLFSSRSFAEANPDALKRVQATFDELAIVLRERPQEAISALKKIFPKLSDKALVSAFEQNSPNWLHPELSVEDLSREISMREAEIPNTENIDPASLKFPR